MGRAVGGGGVHNKVKDHHPVEFLAKTVRGTMS